MNREKRQTKLHNLHGIFRGAADTRVTMRIRLLAFLVALVVTMVLGVVVILLATKPLTVGGGEAERFVQKELSYLTQKVTEQCGDTSVQLVLLSQALSKSIEYQLIDRQLHIDELKEHPEILEEVIGNELNRLQLALEKTKCSGVFMVLDATVNPTLPNAQNSRAGLYIRNSEPNVAGPDTTRLYLRGFPGIALKNGLSLQSKWDMEFNVENKSFYHLPIEKHNETSLPLSRLYYWSLESAIADLGENVLLCSVPLVDSDGSAFGVCGFEISALNFKLNFQPDDSVYKHIACMVSMADGKGLDAGSAMISGNCAELAGRAEREPLLLSGGNGLHMYARENGKTLMGLHEEIKLYPGDSAFKDRSFAVALLIPKEELDAAMFKLNQQMLLICLVLLALGVGVSFYISKKYLSPIVDAIDTIQSDNLDGAFKTNMLEINQLLEKIKALHAKEKPLPDDLFEDFIARVRMLTPTEMEIFRYYLEGKSGKEIVSRMYISANTLKVHNKHIYTKLNVSSKDELLLYIELIKKSGLTGKIA